MNYDILEEYMRRITDNFSIREYSDGTFCVSAYIDDARIQVEGHYSLVLFCVLKLLSVKGR